MFLPKCHNFGPLAETHQLSSAPIAFRMAGLGTARRMLSSSRIMAPSPVAHAATALLAGVAALGILTPRLAFAQTVTVTSKNVSRSEDAFNDAKPWAINYQDCVENVEFTFKVGLTGSISDLDLAVYAGVASSGVNCSIAAQRLDRPDACQELYTKPATASREFKLTAQELVGDDGKKGCEEDIDGRKINLYFALVDTDGNPKGSSTSGSGTSCTGACALWSELEVDLVGPDAPSDASAGIGENQLVVQWTPATSENILSYQLFCDPVPGLGSSSTVSYRPLADAGVAEEETDSGAVAIGSAGSTAVDGILPGTAATEQAGSTGSSDATSSESETDTPATAACGSGALVPGERPDERYRCGSVEGATASRANAKRLNNGVEYAVGVAAVDNVGNVGRLSDVACGTPHSLDDFFEVYRRAGGNGGGGYCAASRQGRPGTLALAMMGALVLAGVLRQRRGRR